MGDPRRSSLVQVVGRARAFDLVLGVVVVIQLVLLVVTVSPITQRVALFRGDSATERSARVAFGDQFGDFVRFVDVNVPENGRVVVPPLDLDLTFGDVGLTQYLLFPREIVNCPSGPDLADCVRSLTGSQTYILRVRDFPAPEDVPPSKGYLPFEGDLGLYYPR
ncbi:MAG: hypothetical protein NTU91_15935 [Chloroflexi bacterium]|jgi:hypothetical protein|nr:hypothetical protein [Chloroflexota bacterium]